MNRNMKLTVDGVMLEINEKQHILNNNKDIEEENADWDRCTYTWENLFRKKYPRRSFWSNTDFDEKKKGTRNAYIEYKGYGKDIEVNYECWISGDTCFNFKPAKYKKFETKLNRDKGLDNDKKQDALAELKVCHEMIYSLHNFSLMPVTGNVNCFKESCGGKLDRLDSFLYYLNKYFCKREMVRENSELYNEEIFKYTRGKDLSKKKLQKDRLISFLDEFRKGEVINGKKGICSATYKYCTEMYLIDCEKEENKKLVEDLIENGSKPIEKGEDVVAYMNLAKRYWKIKDELLKQAESRE